jgi:hypothetical protein
MNRSSLILTHGAVFSVGIAAAMIATRLRTPAPGSGLDDSTPAARMSPATAGSRLDGTADSDPSRATTGSRTLGKKSVKSPSERLQNIVRIQDPFERQRALMDLIVTLGTSEFAALAEQFRELDHLGDVRGEYDLILRGWAKTDPLSALDYVDQHGNSRAARATILSTWAGKDAAAAERWALDHHQGDGPNPHLAAVIQGIAAHDLQHASRLAQGMPQSRERGEAVEAITRALMMQGTAAATAFPASIEDDMLRGGFVSSIANRLAAKDPAMAATWISTLGESDQARAARSVGAALARTDSAGATRWVESLQPEAKAEAARGVIPVMSSADITGTAQWVSGLAGTPNYDRVVEEFVWSCNTRAPEQSAAWIQGVSNPEQQRRLYHRMLGEWARNDASAVKQWVMTNNVPQDVLRRFSR